MSYLVNDIFYTLQGEGFWTGRPAVFVRFARCNLWNGREEDRHRAVCQFCDTDFLKGERYDTNKLLTTVTSLWPQPQQPNNKLVVLTGGEPTLQVDDELIRWLHLFGFYVAIETNGTRPLPKGLDWVCVSPKAGAPLHAERADELKVVWPQQELDMDNLVDFPADHRWISPMDGPNLAQNTQDAIEYVLRNPQWRLNVQTHKVIGVK
jgi:7-carboxy-7-deazaguanine synthase